MNYKLLNAITTMMQSLEEHGIVNCVCQFCGVEIDVDPTFFGHDIGCPYYMLMDACNDALHKLTTKDVE